MKKTSALTLLSLVIAFPLATEALADIRHYHGGTRIGLSVGYGDYRGHHDRGGHHRGHGHFHPSDWSWAHRHRHHHHHRDYFGFSYGPLFAPAWASASLPVYSDRDYDRTVVIRERAPEPVRASTFAPSWTPSGGWKTSAWHQSDATPVIAPGGVRDARSAEQLQQIYGAQGASLAR